MTATTTTTPTTPAAGTALVSKDFTGLLAYSEEEDGAPVIDTEKKTK